MPPSCWPSIRRKGTHWAGLLASSAERTEGDEGLYRGYGEKFLVSAARLCRPGGGPDLGGARQALSAVAFPRLSTPKGRKETSRRWPH